MKSTKMLNYENVKFLCGLIRDVRNIDHLLNDLSISSLTTFSSLKITELAQDVKHELEQYIQSSINGLTHLKKKIVDTLPSDTDAEENILYLVKDTSVVDDVVYNQYLLIDGKLEPLGRTSTDLTGYYSKDESDSKFALLSNLQTLIDMVGNASDLETTAKDTLVNAINEIKEGLDNIDIDNYIKKDAIVTTLDSTCTDEQVLSAKGVYDEISDLIKIKRVFSNVCTINNGVNTIDVSDYMEDGYLITSVIIDNADKKPLYVSRVEQNGTIQVYNPNEQFTGYISIIITIIKGTIKGIII